MSFVQKDDKILILLGSEVSDNDIKELVGEINLATDNFNDTRLMRFTELQTCA